jgi:hypothetical protein
MSLLNRLLGRTEAPKTRTRVCIECGKPVDQHQQWCAIWRTQQALDEKASASRTT